MNNFFALLCDFIDDGKGDPLILQESSENRLKFAIENACRDDNEGCNYAMAEMQSGSALNSLKWQLFAANLVRCISCARTRDFLTALEALHEAKQILAPLAERLPLSKVQTLATANQAVAAAEQFLCDQKKQAASDPNFQEFVALKDFFLGPKDGARN